MPLQSLPRDVLRLILAYLPQKQLGRLAQVSRSLRDVADDDFNWRDLLKTTFWPAPTAPVPTPAKTIFLSQPMARLQFIGFDDKGRTYVNQLIDATLEACPTLTPLQKAHLGAELTRKKIINGELTIEAALANSQPDKLAGLNEPQQEGIKLGLTADQVKPAELFTNKHVECIKNKKFTYEQIRFLKVDQIKGMQLGLTRQQVFRSWFSAKHVEVLFQRKFSYNEIKGLKAWQIEGLEHGLTRAQVEEKSMSQEHIEAVKAGIKFKEIKKLHYWEVRPLLRQLNSVTSPADKNIFVEQNADLNVAQVEGMKLGLTREQVKHAWFGYEHFTYMRDGLFTYEQVRELNKGQIEGLQAGLTRGQVQHAWFTSLHAKCIKEEKLSYQRIEGLDENELRRLMLGLTKEQMNQPWFAEEHANLLETGKYTYAQVEGLDGVRLAGLKLGLTREQVLPAWFSQEHVSFLSRGIPCYKEMKGLNGAQVIGVMCCELTREQVLKPWFNSEVAQDIFNQRFSYAEVCARKEKVELLAVKPDRELLKELIKANCLQTALPAMELLQEVGVFKGRRQANAAPSRQQPLPQNEGCRVM